MPGRALSISPPVHRSRLNRRAALRQPRLGVGHRRNRIVRRTETMPAAPLVALVEWTKRERKVFKKRSETRARAKGQGPAVLHGWAISGERARRPPVRARLDESPNRPASLLSIEEESNWKQRRGYRLVASCHTTVRAATNQFPALRLSYSCGSCSRFIAT